MNRPLGGGFGIDRTRSVFVGNISYEVTEEQLRDVFSKVGTVVHLRMVYDRETSKPKGYGFCEYAEAKSAELAIRNLNGYELNGRALRVDSASGDQRHMPEGGPEGPKETIEESMYGGETDPANAPTVISRSVASLPPEKMFQLMKQMKDVVLTNPTEAKNMLIQNPQLAYALLQAQVVMRIVDPQVAMTMLHREAPMAKSTPFHAAPSAPVVPGPAPAAFPPQQNNMPPPSYGGPSSSGFPPQGGGGGPPPMPPQGYGGPPPGGSMPPQGAPGGYGRGGGGGGGGMMGGNYSDSDRDNAELLMQVLQLSEAEIAQFPLEERQKVLALRNQLRNV